MGLKDLFFESAEPAVVVPSVAPVVPQVSLNTIEGTLTIPEIYEKLGMADLSQSVYKIKETKEKLPAKMTEDMKRETIVATMSVVGLNIETLVADGQTRVTALNDVLTAYSGEANQYMKDNEIKIAELEAQIEQLKKLNEDKQKSLETQTETINNEIKVIDETINFVFVHPTAKA